MGCWRGCSSEIFRERRKAMRGITRGIGRRRITNKAQGESGKIYRWRGSACGCTRARAVTPRSLVPLLLALVGLVSLSSTSIAKADTPYLVGFLVYRSDANGAALNNPYFFTSNV